MWRWPLERRAWRCGGATANEKQSGAGTRAVRAALIDERLKKEESALPEDLTSDRHCNSQQGAADHLNDPMSQRFVELGNQVVERLFPVSYTHLDVYKRQLFHQCVAGPIVRYKTIAHELFVQRDSRDLLSGISRFTVGLAKKTLLANPCGALADQLLLSTDAASNASLFAENLSTLSRCV